MKKRIAQRMMPAAKRRLALRRRPRAAALKAVGRPAQAAVDRPHHVRHLEARAHVELRREAHLDVAHALGLAVLGQLEGGPLEGLRVLEHGDRVRKPSRYSARFAVVRAEDRRSQALARLGGEVDLALAGQVDQRRRAGASRRGARGGRSSAGAAQSRSMGPIIHGRDYACNPLATRVKRDSSVRTDVQGGGLDGERATGPTGSTEERRRLILVGLGRGRARRWSGFAASHRPSTVLDPSKIAKVEKGDIARSVVATGKIQPLTKVEVKSKASGIVKKLYVHYGDHVKNGQVLAELDRELLEASVREAAREPARGRGRLRAHAGRGRGSRPALPEVRRSSGRASSTPRA